MADIFLSYNREDQALARLFAEGFAAQGFTVWWDSTLRAGEAYDEVTEAALRSAKAVVVLWSTRSVVSRWVRAEATLAQRNGTLVPCMIEHCDRPIMFELTQTSDLCDWAGERDDPRWLAFVGDVARHVARGHDSLAAERRRPPPTPAPAPSPRPSPPPPAPQSERRHLTFLSCRLEESGGTAQLDPEDWQEIVRRAQPLVSDAIATLGGTPSWQSGMVSALFGFPVAQEDAAERAIHAGLAIVAALAGQRDVFAATHGAGVTARIGIHCANALVGLDGQGQIEVFGDGPAIAARTRAAAPAGAVAFTGDVAELVAGVFDQQMLPALPPSEGGAAVPLFQALGVRPDGRHQAKTAGGLFVGRDDELALLMSRWRRLADHDGQHILIRGEPGIGKSRLLGEFRSALAGQPHRWIGWSGESLFANTPFHAVVQMLRQLLEARGGDPAEALRRELAVADMPADAFDLVATLIGLALPADHAALDLTPAQRRRQLTETLTEWVFALTRDQPLVLAVEDLHWVDPSTLELVRILVEQGGTLPLMVIGTARPEFRKAWLDRDHHGQINLGRLGSGQTRVLVADAIGAADIDDALVQKLVARTDGVPFFVQELARQIVIHGSQGAIGDIPTTLRGLLAARLDRLGAARETAQLGAILGRSFSHAMISAFAGLDGDELAAQLGQMVSEELVQQRGVAPRASYMFKHALTHEAAYELLPKARRRQEHRRAAALICAQFDAEAQAHPEIVAWHYSRGGNPEQAAHYWLQAGTQALRRNAHLEAMAHLHDALTAVAAVAVSPQRDAIELEVEMALGTAVMVAKGQASPENEKVWRRALDLASKLGDTARQGQALFGLWQVKTVRADHQASLAHAQAILDLARQSGSEELLLTGTLANTSSCFFLGKVDEVIDNSNTILAHYDPDRHAGHRFQIGVDAAAMARAYRAQALWLKGDHDAAAAASAEALAFARQLNHLYSFANVLAYSAWIQQYSGAADDVSALAAELTDLSAKERVPLFLGNGVMLSGWLACQRGENEGPQLYAQGLDIYRATGSRCFLPYRWALLGNALSAAGDHVGAAAAFADALAAIAATSERWAEPAVCRLHARALERAGAEPAAIAASL
uniref:AAA family ATPase n=1 Tax=Sandarakinorhabdus oryzae TaxID=2675220 RepID=UPI0012E1301D